MLHSLYLHPAHPLETTDPDTLLEFLEQIQFISALWRSPDNYLAGDRLLQHISFVGCSPHLEFSPQENGDTDLCFVQMHGPYSETWGFVSRLQHRPRCPNCGCKVRDWEAFLPEPGPVPDNSHWRCPECQTHTRIEGLSWRRQAVFGRCFVEIHGVFPGEALPTDQLLEEIKAATGIDWQYGWAESSRG